ncbi:hypothetical protein [Peterkaempfera sp. SMS 1(5)a]|uniref:hypothetical protein n=1 Tax=Peterkaempfera podocarpi TaxID=3232308 RepID=UPI00366BAE32
MATSAPGPEPEPPAAGGLDELRQRIAALEQHEPPPAVRRHRVRAIWSVLLIVLASVLSVPSVVAVWASSIVGDTDRYVATVAPLASDPDIQQAVTRRTTAVVLDRIDVPSVVDRLAKAAQQKGVPPQAADLLTHLSGPIRTGLGDLVGSTVQKVVSSSAFETIWIEANRTVHSSLDKALTGKGGGAVSLQNNQVSIDLGPVIARVKDQLVKAGFGPAARIPALHTQFVVFASQDIGRVKTGFRLLELAGGWLPAVTVLIAAAGVLLAARRRRALVGAALGVAAAMLVLGVVLAAFRAIYLDRLPPGVSTAAAASVFDALSHFLRSAVRAVFALAAVTALGAFLIGPSRPAVTVRTACRNGIGAVRGTADSAGLHLGAVGRFVHRRKRPLGVLILAVGAVVLFTWNYPTTGVVLWCAFAVLMAFAVREFLDTGP